MSKLRKKTATVTHKAALTAQEHERLDELAKTCVANGVAVNRDLLLRAAIGVLAMHTPASLEQAWRALAPARKAKK